MEIVRERFLDDSKLYHFSLSLRRSSGVRTRSSNGVLLAELT